MSLPAAVSIAVLAAIFTNRIIAVGVGIWFQVPVVLLLGLLLLIDVAQIPFYYRLYEHGSTLFDGVPFLKALSRRDLSQSSLGKWAQPLGGCGVVLVSAMPTLGGGIWTSTLLAYGLGMKRNAAYAWVFLGSLLSYLLLYGIMNTLIHAVRYFVH